MSLWAVNWSLEGSFIEEEEKGHTDVKEGQKAYLFCCVLTLHGRKY